MTDRHALPRAAGSIRLIGVKKNHRLSRWVAFELLAKTIFILSYRKRHYLYIVLFRITFLQCEAIDYI